jgi:predicted transcriptional regulator
MSNDDMVVNVLKYKIARFACLDVHELGNILKNLVDKGFIKEIENNTEAVDTSIVYRLIAI